MQKIHVNVGDGYFVHIGKGLIDTCGETVKAAVTSKRVLIVTDSNVQKLYLERAEKSLSDAGFEVFSFVFSAGETSKTFATLADILEYCAECALDRKDCIVALGGGVTGDLAGFAAGCYMRGISCVQIPTTLLAAVDSSVGGKTAVDLKAGKNLAGVFLQPKVVICDTDCLKTLDRDNFSCGMAEAIKTGILSGEELFGLFEKEIDEDTLEEIIGLCVKYKGSIVETDEKESGIRKALNLGHTAAHGIEKASGYTVLHGQAVAVGIMIIARAASRLWGVDGAFVERLEAVFKKHNLPTETQVDASVIAEIALSDKKKHGNSISLVVPHGVGRFEIKNVPTDELTHIFSQGK